MSKLLASHDAQHLFDTLPPDEPGDRLVISAARLREMFANGAPIPLEFGRPEVVDVLRELNDGVTRQ